ncbi:MAG: glycosyltransferase family 39 protein, partial [Roseburia sp.]|nr:glycosyltransferase family 39 protein [Roseburia sp.]
MKILDKKKRTILILVLICSVQLIVSLLYAEQKSFLYPDELFSYVSANRVDGVSTDFPANEWVDENWYLDYLTVQSEHRFEYSIPWNNQATDVHPPLYYLFVHTTCSLIPEQFSFVAGIGFNIFFFLGSTIGLYFVGKELFKDSNFGLLLAFIFAFSYAGLNTMVFIRMYMLMTFILIWHVYVYLKYFEQDVESMKGYAGLAITLILGVLTQYYF